MKNSFQHSVILFDGVCNLCNFAVQFIIKKDTKQKFKFASLQSDGAKDILLQFSEKKIDLDTIIFLNNQKTYYKSSAVLQILSELGGLYKLFLLFWIIPKPIRNFIYDYIASHRYKWYGKKDQCMIPSPELKNRFLD